MNNKNKHHILKKSHISSLLCLPILLLSCSSVFADQSIGDGAILKIGIGGTEDLNCQAVTVKNGGTLNIEANGTLQEITTLTIAGTLNGNAASGSILKLSSWINNGTVSSIPKNIQFTTDCGSITVAGSSDTDGDGISDSLEGGTDVTGDGIPDLDVDGDGIYNFIDLDSDGDTLTDAAEGTGDDDNDGIPNYLDPFTNVDLDHDNDGIPTVIEQATAINSGDTDKDGTPDHLDLDSDNDGIKDVIEAGGLDPDNDGHIGTGNITDADSDGLDDSVDTVDSGSGAGEVSNGTALSLPNTDSDTLPNYQDADDDNDNIPTKEEYPDPNADGNPSDGRDLDADGIADYLDPDQMKPLQYRVTLDEATSRYRVYMKTSLLPTPVNINVTGQVTIKVPHGMGASKFTLSGLNSEINNVTWALGSRVDAPTEDNSNDYLSFYMTNLQVDSFNWVANQEIEVFSFANSASCIGAIALIDNTTDAFATFPNSAGTVASNQFTNLGWGGKESNNYASNYGSPASCSVSIRSKALLQGAYDSSTGLMADDLRLADFIPLQEPFSGSILRAGDDVNSGETTTAAVLATTGNNAIVDWVLLELRSASDDNDIVATRAALIQRDGDIVDTDGSPNVIFPATNMDNYYVALRHRNHLDIITSGSTAITQETVIDFSLLATSVQGQNSRLSTGSDPVFLWAGDTNQDQLIIATGAKNDSNQIISNIWLDEGNTQVNSNYIINGYSNADINIDGKTIYVGGNNDINVLLGNAILHQQNTTLSYNFVIVGGLYRP